ncbi:PREDICTED: cathepsin R-like [Camelina sativa]|uniref:Cathepsin R-like n=1 Tax=Camelina sativa TaxID=90675 RepID=A0ABM0V607_CAMSA|nr:PREDICTED: cathepsin R-like [Camelina sativa]
MDDKWLELMGPVKDQGTHVVCWALVAAEMVSAIRYLKKYDTVKTEYSLQDIVDFTNPEKRAQKGGPHYCYPWYVHKGLEYVSRAGIQREEARPFHRDHCEKDVPPRNPVRLGYIREAVQLKTIEDALVVLLEHPVAGGIPLFSPEYANIKDELFQGPTAQLSTFTGMHAVTIVGANEENGEKYVRVRSSHGKTIGKDGNLKVSIEIMIVCLTPPDPGCVNDPFYPYMYYPYPQPLLSGFTYPTLLSKEEENVRKKNETCPGSWIIDIDPPD